MCLCVYQNAHALSLRESSKVGRFFACLYIPGSFHCRELGSSQNHGFILPLLVARVLRQLVLSVIQLNCVPSEGKPSAKEVYQLGRESEASMAWRKRHYILQMTWKELDCYIARFVQKDGKGPYPPNSDNYVATALSTEALNSFL